MRLALPETTKLCGRPLQLAHLDESDREALGSGLDLRAAGANDTLLNIAHLDRPLEHRDGRRSDEAVGRLARPQQRPRVALAVDSLDGDLEDTPGDVGAEPHRVEGAAEGVGDEAGSGVRRQAGEVDFGGLLCGAHGGHDGGGLLDALGVAGAAGGRRVSGAGGCSHGICVGGGWGADVGGYEALAAALGGALLRHGGAIRSGDGSGGEGKMGRLAR